MRDLLVAFGLVLVLEGLLYAAAPGAMKRLMVLMREQSESSLRWSGLFAALAGLVIVWLIRG